MWYTPKLGEASISSDPSVCFLFCVVFAILDITCIGIFIPTVLCCNIGGHKVIDKLIIPWIWKPVISIGVSSITDVRSSNCTPHCASVKSFSRAVSPPAGTNYSFPESDTPTLSTAGIRVLSNWAQLVETTTSLFKRAYRHKHCIVDICLDVS